MVTFLLITLLVVGLPSAFVVGVRTAQKRIPDYKERWQGAVKLLEEYTSSDAMVQANVKLDEENQLLSKKVKELEKKVPKKESYLDRLLSMDAQTRFAEEGTRLSHGEDLVDPLSNLDNHWYIAFMDRRRRYGYSPEDFE